MASIKERMASLQGKAAASSKPEPDPLPGKSAGGGSLGPKPEGDVIKAGFLDRARIGDRYDKRWVVLTADPALAYYTDEDQKDYKGSAVLKDASLALAEDKIQIEAVDGKGKSVTLRFRASGAADASAWATAITELVDGVPPSTDGGAPRISAEELRFMESHDMKMHADVQVVSSGMEELGTPRAGPEAPSAPLDLSGAGKLQIAAANLRPQSDDEEEDDSDEDDGADFAARHESWRHVAQPKNTLTRKQSAFIPGEDIIDESDDEEASEPAPGHAPAPVPAPAPAPAPEDPENLFERVSSFFGGGRKKSGSSPSPKPATPAPAPAPEPAPEEENLLERVSSFFGGGRKKSGAAAAAPEPVLISPGSDGDVVRLLAVAARLRLLCGEAGPPPTSFEAAVECIERCGANGSVAVVSGAAAPGDRTTSLLRLCAVAARLQRLTGDAATPPTMVRADGGGGVPSDAELVATLEAALGCVERASSSVMAAAA